MSPHRFVTRLAGCAAVLLVPICGLVDCSDNQATAASADAGSEPCAPSSAESPTNYVLSFDGTGQYASTGTADFPAGNKPQTISLWVWYASTAGTQAIVTLRSDFASGLVLGIRDGTLGAFMVNPLTGGTLVAIETPPPPQTWIHVAYVYDGSTASLYVNGAVAATNAVSANIQIPTTSWLGTLDGYSQFFAGEMDEIRIWSVARKPSDILADMQGTVASNAPGLVAYFDCNEACGTRMPDESGNGNDATLGGGDPAFMPQLVAADVPPDS